MKEVVITKRGKASNCKNPLENFSVLRIHANKSSALAKRKAKENGIAITIIKNNKIYKIFPDGRKIEIYQSKTKNQNSFEPITIAR